VYLGSFHLAADFEAALDVLLANPKQELPGFAVQPVSCVQHHACQVRAAQTELKLCIIRRSQQVRQCQHGGQV